MTRKINWQALVVSLLIPQLVGFISGLLSGSGTGKYNAFIQPPLSPPGIVFPIVWFVLYLLMGIAFYIVWQSGASPKLVERACKLYFLQLFVNFLWSILFFGLDLKLLSFFWIFLFIILVIMTAVSFYRINKTAAYLLIPYIIWISFASYLNLAVWFLNK